DCAPGNESWGAIRDTPSRASTKIGPVVGPVESNYLKTKTEGGRFEPAQRRGRLSGQVRGNSCGATVSHLLQRTWSCPKKALNSPSGPCRPRNGSGSQPLTNACTRPGRRWRPVGNRHVVASTLLKPVGFARTGQSGC